MANKPSRSVAEMVTKVMTPTLIQVILLISIAIPLIFPMGMPVTVSDNTRAFYEEIMSLPEGSTVLWVNDMETPAYFITKPCGVAIGEIICRRRLKFIMNFFNPDGSAFWRDLLSETLEKYNYEYGKDYAILTFLPGEETAYAAYASNIKDAYPFDIFGNPTKDLPVLEGINNLADGDLVITQFGYCTQIEGYVRQWTGKMGMTFITYTHSGCPPLLVPYYDVEKGPVKGWVAGAIGGVELETLSGFKGEGSMVTDSKNIAFGFILITIILGNYVYYAKERRE